MGKTKLDEVQLQVIINGDRAGKTMSDLQQAQKQIVAELRNMKIGSEEWVKKMEDFKKVNTQLTSIQKDIKGVHKEMASGKEVAKELAGAFGLAFGVEKVIEFGKESLKAFMDAEKNAHNLEFTLNNISGEGKGALDRLISQSEQLQEKSIFSDDDIQVSQKMLLQLNLTSKEVESLIPQVLDLATAQGVDLNTATSQVIDGLNGKGKALKQVGINLRDTGDVTKNLADLQKQLTKYTGEAATQMDTASGRAARLANDFDNLKESVGEFIMGAAEGFMTFLQNLGVIEQEVESFEDKMNKQKAEHRQAVNDLISDMDEKALKHRIEVDKKYLQLLLDGRAVAFKNASKEELQAEVDKVKLSIETEESGLQKKIQNKIRLTTKGREEQDKIYDQELKDYQDLLNEIEKITKKNEKKKMTDREKELDAVDEYFDKLLKKAAKHAVEEAKLLNLKNEQKNEIEERYLQLEMARTAEEARDRVKTVEKTENTIGAIRQKQRKSDHMLDVEYWQKWKSLQDRRVDAAQSVHDSLTNIANLGAAMGEDMAGFMKALALFQIGIDTAKAVSGAIASAQDLAYPYNLIAMGTAVTAVLGAIGQAYTILNDENQPTAPQFAEGGPMVNPSFKNGGAVNKPFMAIAGEAGPEWVAPNWMVESPKLAPIFSILEDIRQTKTFAAGGPMTSNVSTSTPVFTGKTSTANSELTYQLKRLNDNLEGGIYALFDWDYYQKSTTKIAAAKNSATIGK